MNKKLLKIGSAISMLNVTAPILANATIYKSIYTTGRMAYTSKTIILNTTSGTPAAVLSSLRKNRALGRTTVLQSTSPFSRGVEIVQPYNPPQSNKIQFKHTYFPH